MSNPVRADEKVAVTSDNSVEKLWSAADSSDRLAATPPISWRKVALQAFGVWLATRVVFALVTYIAVNFYTTGFKPVEMGLAGPFPPPLLLQSWNRWDTNWYLRITTNGYEGDVLRTAFFPLYPMLIKVFALGGGENVRLGVAMIISNLGALAAFIAVGLIASHEAAPKRIHAGEHDPAPDTAQVLSVMAAYPFAFFTVAAYADGLFFGLAAFSIFFARRGLWYWAALMAFLAGLTRPTGVILVLPLAWEYARQHGWLSRDWRERLRLNSVLKALIVWGAVPLAIGLYAAYLWAAFGNPLVFVEAQSHWGHQLVPIWELPFLLVGSVLNQPMWSFTQSRLLIDVVPIVVFTALTLLGARRLPAIYTLYMVGALIMSLASPLVGYFNPFASVGRYLLVAFPAFLLLARWTKRYTWLHVLVIGGGFMLQALLAAFFLMGGWMV
jgi:hypothetical protein